jgi:cation:H+ antiporter
VKGALHPLPPGDLVPWTPSPTTAVVLLGVAAIVLGLGGTRFTRLVDRLADRTGMGEALAGAVLVGAVTSLPGLIASVVGAAEGNASFAVSNSLGGIAAQTAFLVLADVTYRRANLEHAAASLANLLQTLLLITLVGVVLLAVAGPDVSVLGVHPATAVLPAVYLYGLRLTRAIGKDPLWSPKQTQETREDVPEQDAGGTSLPRLWAEFSALALVVAGTGYLVAVSGLSLIEETGLSSSFVGAGLTAVVTSLPELVTVLVAVRIGALTLAVGNIIGGNSFDVLFVAAADLAYRDGSIYRDVDAGTQLVLASVVILTAVLAAGLVRRQRGGVGFEGVVILAVYVGTLAVTFTT